jgi:plastocyanin
VPPGLSDHSPGRPTLGRPGLRSPWTARSDREPTGLGIITQTKEINMKHMWLVPTVCALSLAGVLTCAADEKSGDKKAEAKPITVTMKSLSYDPKKLEVHVGDSVVWTNKSRTAHTATSDDEGKTFDTDEVEPGKSSKPVKFEKEGEFKYHCKVHGKTMSGTVVVKAGEKK